MTGFDTSWLALREPVDCRARNEDLLGKTARFIASDPKGLIVDIGSGTGSTFRAMGFRMPSTRWRLIDHDPRLLGEAARRHVGNGNITYEIADLNHVSALPLDDANLVTASALFDLCSRIFIEELAQRLVGLGTGLYAALNYNGEMTYEIAHPEDAVVLELFNFHQRSDKGFGVALGPQSADVTSDVFASAGYSVEVARSDWVIDERASELHQAFVDGVATAVSETGKLQSAKLADWRDFRLKAIGRGGCRVGHTDVLALPRTSSLRSVGTDV
ncbi:class I SAM-dependent methyltransferase [Phyllobacterium lublinensis]|uniref:class I SAM-dependent methyltransferase n=1 Tax=Phyllobacterium lublinensis TaxID=2875708 RepID=UPI001CCB22D9|nr:class I SAM-dependent methyltransferase [Phyllobacterium sp. 2063]MBZ9655457.1 class I SAM-dependent methyltransferase [Phyllobacterium sp. 2063]